MLDLVAREAGLEPFEVRMKNLVRPEQMPRSGCGRPQECPRAPEARRAGRAPHRHRPLRLLRARRAWHVGLCRLGHSDGAGA
jgi:carbon-monoxide dehydrogenase large subunit